MKDIAIYGFGGFGREIASIIFTINNITPTWNIIGFIDDGAKIGSKNKYGMVLGNIAYLNTWTKPLNVIMAIANTTTRLNLVSKITNSNISFPNIIAPSVLFFDKDTFSLGQGNILCHSCRISCDVTIGNFNLLNGDVSLGHDVKLGDYNVLQPEVRISGESAIGNVNFFGARSCVLQNLVIGNLTRIGTGSVVMRKTKDSMSYFGNPAKILKINE